ncbi:MAG TPA: type II toxin-antitoxin system PemK/MazF family toxin [Planctomycetota bacterium]|nr:type II toxin-antitoxin system PemK/MazF family toxin [Planctomycetota bacterium]
MREPPSQGEVWLAGLTDGPARPAIIVSRNELNRGRLVLVVPCTTARVRERAALPNHVLLPRGEAGLSEDSVAQAHLIQHLDVSLLVRRLGCLDTERLADVLLALAWSVDLFGSTDAWQS